SVRHVLTVNGYGGRQTKENEKSWCFKGWETLVNYIYVRMGACTFIHKRTSDDIWKNLFELPLVETDRNLSEEEFLSSVSFRSLIAEGEVPEVRLVFRNVKHVLSHRVIYANFYEVVLPENSRSFSEYQCIRMEDLEQYPVSRLVHAFLEKYL
ncbi:MAG: NUDIX domain-containing protein, partial [Bacteroides stercoris]|nr:NUDIX domain-containing protein [Bacteroides stercoris]